MCLPKPPDPPKPDILPAPPPAPETAPKAPKIADKLTPGGTASRRGRSSLRIDLNPAVSGSSLLIK